MGKVPGDGTTLTMVIKTRLGAIHCELDRDNAPQTVTNLVALVLGRKPWLDPNSKRWTSRPFLTDRAISRRARGFLIGFGAETGYVFPDEAPAARHHVSAGVLGMQNRGADTNSGRFYITVKSAPHLVGRHTPLGHCTPLDVLRSLADESAGQTAPRIMSATLRREPTPPRRPPPGPLGPSPAPSQPDLGAPPPAPAP